MTAQPEQVVVWEPRSWPQYQLLRCPVFEVFFGGARGSLKTDGMLGDWLNHAGTYGNKASGLMVRRERVQLMDTYERAKQIYLPLGFKFVDSPVPTCRSPDGALLEFSYLDRDQDADAHQGKSRTRVYVEELGNFARPEPVLKMMAILRSAHGVPCGFRGTGNPGGPGHQWVKARYIDGAPPWQVRHFDFENPWTHAKVVRDRVFIPGKITDHNLLGPEYIANLQMVGSAALVKAWLEGDWSAIEGAFFDAWSQERHVLRAVPLPGWWLRFCSFDEGYAAPFSVGWWAVAGEGWTHPDGHTIPRGAMVRYREWYGASGPNTGVKMDADLIAAGILDREKDEKINYRVADPAIFATAPRGGGPSIAERMAKAKVLFRRGDNSRVGKDGAFGGWDQMRSRLRGNADGHPMIFTFDTCLDSIRTIPMLQHDPNRIEDVDTQAEDHAADEWRYACMSRPWVRPKPETPSKAFDTRMPTFGEMMERQKRNRAEAD